MSVSIILTLVGFILTFLIPWLQSKYGFFTPSTESIARHYDLEELFKQALNQNLSSRQIDTITETMPNKLIDELLDKTEVENHIDRISGGSF